MSRVARALAAAALPLVTAAALAWFVVSPAGLAPAGPFPTRVLTLDSASASNLESLFAGFGYTWPPQDTVPPVSLAHLPDDLAGLQPATRKGVFLRLMLPLVIAANNGIRRERHYIVRRLRRDGPVTPRLRSLKKKYRVAGSLADAGPRRALLRRCDTVPAGLVLAQAAKESGWGTSTFARDANNLFGVWTWNEEAGITPMRRSPGAHHLVRAYPDLRASVRDYLYNLNVGHAYQAFRRARARARAAGHAPSASGMAATLKQYSQRRGVYTSRLEALIRQNGLDALGGLHLVPLSRVAAAGHSPIQGNSARLKSQ